jgi:PII-like signaling protein
MKLAKVTMVRIYITESSSLLKPIVNYLHYEAKVRGVSVFRAISGFGQSGENHASLVDLALNLPLTIEFFDHPEQVKAAIEHLSTLVKPEHIVFWEAEANDNAAKA